MRDKLILASASAIRAQLLQNAGLSFQTVRAKIDERQLERDSTLVAAKEMALLLAQAKAHEVSKRYRDAVIIGCDQTLELDQTVLHKVDSLEDAQKRLQQLSGKTHELHSAFALVKNEQTIALHVETAALTVRPLKLDFIAHYLKAAGPDILSSVGCYQIENLGVHLFSRIEGNNFVIMGVALLALLEQLRTIGMIDG